MDDELDLPWGTVPAVIVDLARLIAKNAATDARRAEKVNWPDKPGDARTSYDEQSAPHTRRPAPPPIYERFYPPTRTNSTTRGQ